MTATLQQLESLARERTTEKRRALLRAISDCFFATSHHSASEMELYSEVVMRVLGEVEPVARAELSERIADIIEAPHKVVLVLAKDEIIVAKPVLTRSVVLNEGDLERLARDHSQDHLVAIATRMTLTERVTDVLVSRGDQQVVGTVVANQGARFSHESFAALADRATADEMLLDRLGTRMDLPVEITTRMVPLISEAFDAKLKAVGVVPVPAPVAAPKPVIETGLGEPRIVTSRRDSKERTLEVIMDEVERGVLKLDDAVVELAELDATPSIARLISPRVSLRPDTVTRALLESADEPVALLCRGAGLALGGYTAVVRMRRRRRRGSDSAANKLMEQYREIPLPTAQRVLGFLKSREGAEAR
jgi:Uncharacterised protein conserved in bacteria (DUF2336)